MTAARRTGRHWDARRTHKYGSSAHTPRHTHTPTPAHTDAEQRQPADDGHTKVDLDFELSKPKTN